MLDFYRFLLLVEMYVLFDVLEIINEHWYN